MDQEYDAIVLGTGLKECIISGLLSIEGKKVLHMDRNPYYGGECASLNLEQLYEKFRPGTTPPKEMGRARDYCVDLCPKFLMACGNLVKVLLHTQVTKYLEFKSVTGSFVVQSGKVHKVPSTPAEALSSGLLGLFQKRRFRTFLQFASSYDEKDPKTHEGLNLDKMTTRQLFEYYKLEDTTQQFTGHAIALQPDEAYMDQPAKATIELIKLYAYSVSRYGNSPYIYPVYGLGGLPEGFSRLCAIHGGTYMLNKPVAELVYGEDGKIVGVKDTEGAVAKTKQVICDPSYVLNTPKVKQIGKIIRAICVLSHPIPNTADTESNQIIIPFQQIPGRKSDIYVLCVSYAHKVCVANKWIAVISTNQESNAAPGSDAEKAEIKPALDLLGKIDELFFEVVNNYAPADDGKASNVFVTSSYDATSHFESATDEVIDLYRRVTGKELDLTIPAEIPEQ